MGKTTFAFNIAENLAMKQGLSVLFFSLEMGAEHLARRFHSSIERLSAHKLRTDKLDDEGWESASSVHKLENGPFFIDNTETLTMTDLASRAPRLMTQTGPLSLIVVDYIQLMTVETSKKEQNLSRTEIISELSHALKDLACELNCPVIAVWQLRSRSLEKRSDRRPLMSDLPDAIQQDADVILFFYRDVVYNNDTSDKKLPEVIVAKKHKCPVSTLSPALNDE